MYGRTYMHNCITVLHATMILCSTYTFLRSIPDSVLWYACRKQILSGQLLRYYASLQNFKGISQLNITNLRAFSSMKPNLMYAQYDYNPSGCLF